MSAIRSEAKPRDWRRQVVPFAAIGVFGYLVDSTLTYALVRFAGLDPLIARLPAFAVATIANFLLNRRLTFADTRAPIFGAFARYVMVSAAGLAVNWAIFAIALGLAERLGLPHGPETLPVFVAAGTGVAMFVTFFGFKMFAFRA